MLFKQARFFTIIFYFKIIQRESTINYRNNLIHFLDKHNFSFMGFNPYLTEKFRQVYSLRKTKINKIDPRIIFKMLVIRDYATYSSESHHIFLLNH